MASEEASPHNQLDEERPSFKGFIQYAYPVMVEFLDIRPILFKTRNIGDTGSYGIHIDRAKLMNCSSDSERKQYILEHAERLGYIGIEWLISYLQDSNQTPLWDYLTNVFNGKMTHPNSQLLERIKQHKLMREKTGSLWYETVFQCVWFVMVECLDVEPIITGIMTEGLTETDILSIKLQTEGRNACQTLLNILESKKESGLEWLVQYLQTTNQDALRDHLAKIRNGDTIYPDDQLLEYFKAETKARRTKDTEPVSEEREHRDVKLYQRVLDTSITVLKDSLVPQPVLDEFKSEGFLSFTDVRDIEEMQTTTERNRTIIERVRQKGKTGYIFFKECLTRTKQNKLRTYMEKVEKGGDSGLEKLRKTILLETKARKRREKRSDESTYQLKINNTIEELTIAIKKKKDFTGKKDVNARFEVQGSNSLECCNAIKLVIEQKMVEDHLERIVTPMNEIKNLMGVEFCKAEVEKDTSVLLKMPCSSCREMRSLLKTLKGDTFLTGISKLKKALEEIYEDSNGVQARIDTETLLEDLCKEGIIDEQDRDRICDKHQDTQSEFYCSFHDTFCCENCIKTTHRPCSGVRQCATAAMLEAEKDQTAQNLKKEYRVRTNEQDVCTTFGSHVLSSGEILLIDNFNDRLKKIDVHYNVDDDCNLPAPPFDIAGIDNENILVSFGTFIQFVFVKQNPTLGKTMTLEKQCFRLAWHRNSIYYTDNYSVYRCDAEGKNQKLVHRFEGGKHSCKKLVVSEDGKKIYVAAREKGLLIVKIENNITENQNQAALINRELRDCTSVCVVNDDSILVCDYKLHTIFLVASSDGAKQRTLADKASGLQNPWSLSVDHTDSTVVVGQLGRDFIAVFQCRFPMIE